MEAMIQPVTSCTIIPESQSAESLSPHSPSFHEVFGKRISSDGKDAVSSSTTGSESHPPSAASAEGSLQNPVSGDKDEGNDEELEQRKVDAPFLLNLLPILPNLGDGDSGIKIDASEIQPQGQASSPAESAIQSRPTFSILTLAGGAENPALNILPTIAQATPDSSAAAISAAGPEVANILHGQENEPQAGPLSAIAQFLSNESNPQASIQGTAAESLISQEEGAASLSGRLPDPSLGKVPIPSPSPGEAVQAKETLPKTEPIPTLLAKPKETSIAPFADVVNELPKAQESPLLVMETTSQNPIGAMRNGASSPKSESRANPLGQKVTIPGVGADSATLLEFDEKLNFLLGQNSAGKEVPGQSSAGEFIELGNPLAEKNSPKVIPGGSDQPTQDPFGFKGIMGDPKLQTGSVDPSIPQKLQPAKTENVGLYQQVAEKLVWSARNNEERIRLTLEPPQLGNLFIELHREKEGIKATLWADNPKTKEILENNQFQLQKTLEGHGFKLEKYDVFLQNDMASFQGKEEKSVFHGMGSPEESSPIRDGESAPGLEILPAAIPVAGGSQYIDRFI